MRYSVLIALVACAQSIEIRGPTAPVMTIVDEPAYIEVKPASGRKPPCLAIIIDDIGTSLEQVKPWLELGIPLSFAVLPNAPNSREVATYLSRIGRDVLVHIPMEPDDPSQMEDNNFLTTTQNENEIRTMLNYFLASVPGAIGANNHMGSRFTRDSIRMGIVMKELERHKMFFVDSKTTAQSVALVEARAARVAAIQRDIFLDSDPCEAAVADSLSKLITTAKQKGYALGIGHPKETTLKVIALFAKNPDPDVEVVSVSSLFSAPCVVDETDDALKQAQ